MFTTQRGGSTGARLALVSSWPQHHKEGFPALQQHPQLVSVFGHGGRLGGSETGQGKGGLGPCRGGNQGFHLQIQCPTSGWGAQRGAAHFSAGKITKGDLRNHIAGPAAFPGGKGQMFPSSEETHEAATDPAGCINSHFITTAPMGAG